MIDPHGLYEGWKNPKGGKWFPKSEGRVAKESTFILVEDKSWGDFNSGEWNDRGTNNPTVNEST